MPITGLANAVVAPAMEFKQEGMITGTAAKLFTVVTRCWSTASPPVWCMGWCCISRSG